MIRTISGIVGYSVTPLDTISGRIDISALHESTEHLINSGVNAIAALGCAGECAYLDDKEWKLVVEQSIKIVDKRIPIVIGITELTINKAIQKAIFAEKHGANVLMIAPLKQYELTEAEIYTYFLAISDVVSIPIMVYNNPAICGIDMSPELIILMAENIKNVCMVKDSSHNINRIHQLQEVCGSSVGIFTGSNHLALEALKLGISGWCTVTPNLISHVPLQIFNAIKQNNIAEAEQLFSEYESLMRFLVDKGLAKTVKAGLELKGISVGKPRNPVSPLSSSDIEILKKLLTDRQ